MDENEYQSIYLDANDSSTKSIQCTWQGHPKQGTGEENCKGLSYACVAKGSREGTWNATIVVDMSYGKGIVLCEQFWGSINGAKFKQIVKSAIPLALDKRINPVERRMLMDECPRQNSKVAKKTMENINAIVMATPARSPD